MAKISSQQRIQNFRDVVGMINDYVEKFSRFPTSKEIEKTLGMSPSTTKRYKNPIISQMKKKILDEFSDEMIIHVNNAKKALVEHSNMCKKIRDESNDNNEKINASKNIVESNLDLIRLNEDAPTYFKIKINDNVSKNGQEYNYRETEEEARIQEAIESMFS